MRPSRPFMAALRIAVAGLMCLALVGALHLSRREVWAAPAQQATGPNEAAENIEAQEGQDEVGQNNESTEAVEAQEGQEGQNEVGQSNESTESVESQTGQEGPNESAQSSDASGDSHDGHAGEHQGESSDNTP